MRSLSEIKRDNRHEKKEAKTARNAGRIGNYDKVKILAGLMALKMFGESDKVDIIYMVNGKLGICPECKEDNAMMPVVVADGSGNRFLDLECTECAHHCYEGRYEEVVIKTKWSKKSLMLVANPEVVISEI